MRKILLSIIVLVATATFVQASPKGISGFKLGSSIEECKEVQHTPYLQEKTVHKKGAMRKLTLYYGTCAFPNKLLKIKVKYSDKSKDFFLALKEKLEEKYGKPQEWKGDAFGIHSIWKWHFYKKNNQKCSLSIEYNSKDTDLSMGTVLKLSYPEKISMEKKCALPKSALEDNQKLPALKDIPWDEIIP